MNVCAKPLEKIHILTPQSLADLLGYSLRTVEDWRRKGTGPRYLRIGKHVRYRMSDVESWLETRYGDDRQTRATA